MNAALRIALLLAMVVQVAARLHDSPRSAAAFEVPLAPPAGQLRVLSLGDPVLLAQFAALYLQGIDNQDGVGLPLTALDYPRVEGWLDAILSLDPHSSYALMLATHVYAQVPDRAKQRRMLDFAYRAYRADPGRRWRWLAHASLLARHRLDDLDLALAYAQALHTASVDAGVPVWALQLKALLAEERGEYESARIYVGGLLASGRVTDPQEAKFLTSEIARLAAIDGRSTISAK